MENDRRIESLITLLLLSGMIFYLLFIPFAQNRLYNFLTTGDNSLGPERYLRILSVILIFLCVVIAYFKARTKYKFSIYFSYTILLIAITLNFLISGADISDLSSVMDKKGMGTWVCLGLIFVGYHEKRYALFNKLLYLAVLFLSIITIYNLIDFGVGFWRGQALSKYQVLAVNMVWISPYVFLILKHKNQLFWLRWFAIFMGIILALIIQTRSFLIIYFLTLLYDFFSAKRKSSYLILFAVLFAGALYLVLTTEVLQTSLELLVNRGTDDTRTEQLKLFISNLNPIELITGKGFYASYLVGYRQYGYVDNQWLFFIWWGGLIPVLCYFYLTGILPSQLMLRKKLSYETRVEIFIIIIWCLALLGLAIFTTMTIEFYFFSISIILGRLLYKFSNNLA